MEIRIDGPGGSKLDTQQEVPGHLQNYLVPEAVPYFASCQYGEMLFQQLPGKHFDVWISHYFISKRATFCGQAPVPAIELHFTLSRPIPYSLDGLGEVQPEQYQFNLTFLPYIFNTTAFPTAGHYKSIDLHLQVDYLVHLARSHPRLSDFINQVLLNKALSLSRHHGKLTASMQYFLDSLCKSPYTGFLHDLYLEYNVGLLFMDAISNLQGLDKTLFKITPRDREAIEMVRDFLSQNLSERPPSLVDLAHMAGINEFKLKKGFKAYFGRTVFEYYRSLKMENALLLLADENKTVTEIAYELGYTDASQFIKTFKQQYNRTPGDYRLLLKK